VRSSDLPRCSGSCWRDRYRYECSPGGIARFRPATTGLAFIEREMVFADDLRHPGDRFTYERHQGIMCAEVLVPDCVPPEHILGVYVSCPETHAIVQGTAPHLSCEIRAKIFFAQ
jgi:hypothetical protein